MAKIFKMPRKKATIIAAITIVILAIIATIGTVAFLKDNGETEAADLSERVEEKQEANESQIDGTTPTQENTEVQNQEEQSTAQQEESTENTETTEETVVEGETVETENVVTENTNTVETTETEETTGVTETTTAVENAGTEQIQEVEITDTQVITIPERKISEGHLVGWEEKQPIATFVDAIYGESDETTVTKASETTIGKNVTVSEGIITYYVTVKNTTDRKLSNIEIKDEIPTKTTYVESSADNNAQEIKDEETVKALKWFVDIEANGEKTVSFKVKVNEGETGTVINQATANGDESNKEYTAIIEKQKTAVIKRTIDGIEQIVPEPAQIGDTITFAITVTNTGDVAGNTTIKDKQLESILKYEKAEQIGNLEFYYGDTTTPLKTPISIAEALEENAPDAEKEVLTVQDLIEGIEGVKIPQGPDQTVSIVVTVEVKKVDGTKIVNRATIGEKEDVPTNDVEIETIDLSLIKDIEKITKINEDGTTTEVTPANKDFSKELVKVGDTITYRIVARNNGSATLNNVKVLDDKKVTVISAELPERLQNQIDEESGKEGAQLITIGTTIESVDYANTNKNEVRDNLLGRNDLTLEAGEQVTFIVTYTIEESDITLSEFINNAKLVGYYKEVPYEKTDYEPIETLDTELTKTIEKITKVNEDGTTTEVAPANKDFSKELVKVGDTVRYTIVAKNNSSVTLGNVKILDDKEVTVESVTLPTRLQEEGISITTIGSKIAGTDYANTNPDEVSSNLLGRTDITLKPGEQITVEVSYELKASDFEGENYGKTLINSAKFIGFYEGTSYEKEDDVPVETIDTELTKTIEKITKVNEDGTTTEVAPANKDFSKELVEVGDIVRYTIVAKNNSSVTLGNVKILDDKEVTVESVTLPTRLQEEGISITTIGSKIDGTDYENTNSDEVSSNLLGRTDIILKPGEQITVEVSYELKASDFEGENYGKTLINNAKFIGFYEGTSYEKEDDEPVETIDLSLTKNIIEINGEDPSKDGIMPSGIKLTNIGDTITYEIIAKNDGSATLNNVKILDDKNVTVVSALLPERIQNQLNEESGKEGTQLTTIGKIINSAGYNNNNSGNLLGRNDLELRAGEEIKLQVTYSLKKEDMVGAEAKQFINNAKFIGYYKEVPHERDDNATVTVEYTPKKGNLVFEKSWDDDNYTENRPETITVKLQMYVNGKWTDVTTEQRADAVKELTIKDNEITTYRWAGLDLDTKATGESIRYRVVETKIGNVAVEDSAYTQTFSAEYVTLEENKDQKITITNKYKEPSGTILRHYTEQSADLTKAPLDVVFILDTSNSMNYYSRSTNMTQAVNSAINEIIGYNDYNRVSIVGFSGDSTRKVESLDGEVLLSIGRYDEVSVTKPENENCMNISAKTFERDADGNIKSTKLENASRTFEGGTFTQLGIRLGAEELIRGISDENGNIDDAKRTVVIEGKKVTRTPVIILISDGVPTFYTKQYTNVTTSTREGDSIRESAEEGYYTILSAKYYKGRVTDSYDTDAKVLTIGMGISETNKSSTQYGVTVLNPTEENIAKCSPDKNPIAIEDSREYYTYNAATNLYGCMSTGNYAALINPTGKDQKGAYITKNRSIDKDDQKGIDYNYSYADAAHNGTSISTEQMKTWMKEFVTELLPKEFSRSITPEERAQGKVYLDDINTEKTFKLTINGEEYNYEQSSAYLETTESGRMYVNLAAIPAGSTINIEYTTGTAVTTTE